MKLEDEGEKMKFLLILFSFIFGYLRMWCYVECSKAVALKLWPHQWKFNQYDMINCPTLKCSLMFSIYLSEIVIQIFFLGQRTVDIISLIIDSPVSWTRKWDGHQKHLQYKVQIFCLLLPVHFERRVLCSWNRMK